MRDLPDEPDPKYEPANDTEILICAEILRQHGQEVIQIMSPDVYLPPEDKSALGLDYSRFQYIVESGNRTSRGHFIAGSSFGVSVVDGRVVTESIATWIY